MKKCWIFLLSFLIISKVIMAEKTDSPYTVVVVLEAKTGKENLLKDELLKVRNLSCKENACIMYRVHENINNPGEFVLYENWKNQEEHQKQFTKSYIVELAKKLEELLAKPYQVIVGNRL